VKRTELRRKTPLRQSSGLTQPSAAKRTTQRRTAPARAKNAVPPAVRDEVMARDKCCRALFTAAQLHAAQQAAADDPRLSEYADAVASAMRVPCWGDAEPHHIWRAGQGGPAVAWNLAALCSAHHTWVHMRVRFGKVLGLLRPRPPAVVDNNE